MSQVTMLQRGIINLKISRNKGGRKRTLLAALDYDMATSSILVEFIY